MIKLICFDFDGVLADIKDVHYEALNQALSEISPKYIISKEEHIQRYDGLPTTRKLELLLKEKELPKLHFEQIKRRKQELTIKLLQTYDFSHKVYYSLKNLVETHPQIKIYCCSSASRETVRLVLNRLNISRFFDEIICNEDTKEHKPHAQVYLMAMFFANVNPDETLIFEDSPKGIQAAKKSGGHLCIVKDSNSLTYDFIVDAIERAEHSPMTSHPYKNDKLNIVIPMAGRGSRFAEKGYTFPKPLIEINGKPMIQVVYDTLNIKANYIFLCQKEHIEKYNLESMLKLIAGPQTKVIPVEGITEGAACTVLQARRFIDNDNPLIIANSDQYIEWNNNEFFYQCEHRSLDCNILTFTASDKKWSYVKIDEKTGLVAHVAEKIPISKNATCLDYSQKIHLKKHGLIPIGKVVKNKINDTVLSFNFKTKEFEYKKITNWIQKESDNWYRLKVDKCIFKITGDHLVFTLDGWKRVDNLTANDKILSNLKSPNKNGLDILYGTLLGDSTIPFCKTRGCINGGLKFSHSIKQKEWFFCKQKVLSQFFDSSYKEGECVIKNKKYQFITFNGKSHPLTKELRKQFYQSKKIFPSDLELSPLILAVWYMDDGGLTSKNEKKSTAKFSVNAFSEKDLLLIQAKFKKLNIDTYLYQDNGYRLCINKASLNTFFDMISSFIPKCMNYKLHEKWRDKYNNFWENESFFCNWFFSKYTLSKIKNRKQSYCISVEDNENFVCKNTVMHNCGVYWFKKGKNFVTAAEIMIAENKRVNNEFYVAPAINELISSGHGVGYFDVDFMAGLGTPEDLEEFLRKNKFVADLTKHNS